MESTPEQMAEHIRAAVDNLNAVLKEAYEANLIVKLHVNEGCYSKTDVVRISLTKEL